MQPEYWRRFVESHGLTYRELEVPVDSDLSNVGIIFEFLDEEGTRQEEEELYPGIVVRQDGFVPVGSCGVGTGDQYFINVNNGENGPLYRIDHEAVSESGYDPAKAIAVVLGDYRDLLKYLHP